MTILWEFDEKHPKQVSAYCAAPHHFRPRYALANPGHPSYSSWPCYDTDSCGTHFLTGSLMQGLKALARRGPGRPG
jgi:hypothetical protein